MNNEVLLIFDSLSVNEGFARIAASGFVAPYDPTVSTLTEIKTAVSEAVTNCVIHGYENSQGKIHMRLTATKKEGYVDIGIEVWDEGLGIEDVEQALTPLYTSKPEDERSGMGFTVIQTFMDEFSITSKPGQGTKVIMSKRIPQV